MTEQPEPFFTRGIILALAIALAGAAVIAFVFMPLLSPGTDTVTAFLGALAFMLIAMAVGYAARSRE
jgi:hypothetical protein